MYLLRKYVSKHFRRKTSPSSKALLKLETPIILMGVVLAAEIVINKILEAESSVAFTVSEISKTLIVIAVTYVLIVIGDMALIKWSRQLDDNGNNTAHEEVLPLLKSIKNIVLSVAGIFFILQIWGVVIGGLVASLGIAGLVLSFAFKDTLSNIFGGISLILDDSFKKGDLVELNDGEIGYIEEINLRSTKIRNFDSEEVIIPNGLMANIKIKNYAHPTKTLRIRIDFSVAYGTDTEKVEKVVMNLVRAKENILKYPKPAIFLLKMGEYSLEFRVLFFVKDFHDFYVIKSKITKDVYNTLIKNKIEIPYPVRTIISKKK